MERSSQNNKLGGNWPDLGENWSLKTVFPAKNPRKAGCQQRGCRVRGKLVKKLDFRLFEEDFLELCFSRTTVLSHKVGLWMEVSIQESQTSRLKSLANPSRGSAWRGVMRGAEIGSTLLKNPYPKHPSWQEDELCNTVTFHVWGADFFVFLPLRAFLFRSLSPSPRRIYSS